METVVIDFGTASVRAGFGGEEKPRAVLPAILGPTSLAFSFESSNGYIGNSSTANSTLQGLAYPLDEANYNWDTVSQIYAHLFQNELRADLKQHNVIISEGPTAPKVNKEKRAEIIFETFGAAGLIQAPRHLLTLYAASRDTGLVIDCGDAHYGATTLVPIVDGKINTDAVTTLKVGGNTLIDCLLHRLEARTPPISAVPRTVAQAVVQTIGFIATDFKQAEHDSQNTANLSRVYEVPNHGPVEFSADRFAVPELFFQPSLFNIQGDGLATLAYKTATKGPASQWKAMLGNLVLTGGASALPGFAIRLHKELVPLSSGNLAIKIAASTRRHQDAWEGGALMVDFAVFQEALLSKAEYHEKGSAVVHTK